MNSHRQTDYADDLRTQELPWTVGQAAVAVVLTLAVILMYAMASRLDERDARKAREFAHARAEKLGLIDAVNDAYERGLSDGITAMQRDQVAIAKSCVSAEGR